MDVSGSFINENAAVLNTPTALRTQRKELAMSMQNDSTPNTPVPQSTIAPSEKHLEDWFANDMQALIENPPEGANPHNAKVYRQYVLPSGIADILLIGSAHTLVVELKKGAINRRAFTQIMRYLRDINDIQRIALGIMRHPNNWEYRKYDPRVSGILVGHSIEDDDDLLIAAEMVGVTVMTYKYHPDEKVYTFESHKAKRVDLLKKYSYVQSELGLSIQDAWVRNIDSDAKGEWEPSMYDLQESVDTFLLIERHGVKTFYDYMETQVEKENGGES